MGGVVIENFTEVMFLQAAALVTLNCAPCSSGMVEDCSAGVLLRKCLQVVQTRLIYIANIAMTIAISTLFICNEGKEWQ